VYVTIIPGDPNSGLTIGNIFGIAGSVVAKKFAQWFAGRPRYEIVTCKVIREQLQAIAELVEHGKIRPVIDRVFPLAEVQEAHRYSETGRARGKIAIQIFQEQEQQQPVVETLNEQQKPPEPEQQQQQQQQQQPQDPQPSPNTETKTETETPGSSE
jgi:hypothetical protein